MNYTHPIGSEDDVYTLEEFRLAVSQKAFTDYDGHGYLAKDDKYDPLAFVKPSKLAGMELEDATHIVWFNC